MTTRKQFQKMQEDAARKEREEAQSHLKGSWHDCPDEMVCFDRKVTAEEVQEILEVA